MSARDFRKEAAHIPVAREGLPYIGAAAFLTLVSALLGYDALTWILAVLALLVLHFFRDPQRIGSSEECDVLSPADGKVVAVEPAPEPRFTGAPSVKISIFMSVFDVHVNRVPGVVRGVRYVKGAFLSADRSDASLRNEQNWVWVETPGGAHVVLTQVAGLIARRIVCWPREGDRVIRGERFGLIRFGSRLDVYVPAACDVLVSRGDRVVAGESVLCRMSSRQNANAAAGGEETTAR